MSRKGIIVRVDNSEENGKQLLHFCISFEEYLPAEFFDARRFLDGSADTVYVGEYVELYDLDTGPHLEHIGSSYDHSFLKPKENDEEEELKLTNAEETLLNRSRTVRSLDLGKRRQLSGQAPNDLCKAMSAYSEMERAYVQLCVEKGIEPIEQDKTFFKKKL